jgi:hypothetical protein
MKNKKNETKIKILFCISSLDEKNRNKKRLQKFIYFSHNCVKIVKNEKKKVYI